MTATVAVVPEVKVEVDVEVEVMPVSVRGLR